MVKRGDRVSFIWPARREIEHGFVVSNAQRSTRPPTAHLAFRLREVPFDKIRLYAKPDDESITWVRGWLRWWWPPDRERARALQAAYALNGTQIEMKARTIVFAGHSGFVGDWKRLSGDFDKASRDFEQVLADLERDLARNE